MTRESKTPGSLMATESAQSLDVFAAWATQPVTDEIKPSKATYTVARGSSDAAANILSYEFMRELGVPTTSLPPSVFSLGEGVSLQDAAVLMISQSGASQDLVQSAKGAKKAGAQVLALTNQPNSAVEQAADVTLSIGAGPELAVPATKSVIGSVAAGMALLGRLKPAYAAREAALKVMELSAGQIPALWDSTLGFRHGPKSFVTDTTRVTVFLSPDSPTYNYDTDLASELRAQFPKSAVQTIGPGGDIELPMAFGSAWSAPLCVAAAQVQGVIWAQELGLNVDDPFIGQSTLSRVVSGVKLYPVTP